MPSKPWDYIADVKPHAFPIVRHFEKAVRFNFLNMYYDLGGK